MRTSRPRRSSPTSSRAASPGRSCRPRVQPGPLQRGPSGRGGLRCDTCPDAAAQGRIQGRLHRPSRAVPVLRDDGEPAPRHDPDRRHGQRHARRPEDGRRGYADVRARRPQFDTPNHNYDTSDFDQLVSAITAGKLPASALPAVTFLKAPGYQDGHAAYSDPEDEQNFVVEEVNALMRSPDWSSTVVFVNYDDSDGWYDHVYSGVTNPSLSPADNLTNTRTGKIKAGNATSGPVGPARRHRAARRTEQGRCGLGPRLPMIAISPCAAPDTVDHNLSEPGVDHQLHRVQLEPAGDPRLVRPGAREHRRPRASRSTWPVCSTSRTAISRR